jgi:hypothetical protein
MCNAVTSLAVDGCTQFLAAHTVRKPPALGTVSRAAGLSLPCAIAPVCRGGGAFAPIRWRCKHRQGFSRESNPQRHVVSTVLNHEQN